MPEAAPAEPPPTYPPEHHFLRDLAIRSRRVVPGRWVSVVEVDPTVRNRSGAAALGFLTAVVDVGATLVALGAGHQDWTATADLHLTATGWLTGRSGVVATRLQRAGSRTVIVAYDVFDGADRDVLADLDDLLDQTGDLSHLARVATGLVSFARIPRQASAAADLVDADDPAAAMTEASLERFEPPPTEPLLDRIGLVVVDAGAGMVELPPSEYIRNSFGAMNGGVLGMVAQAAAEAAVPTAVATDVQIHYLAQAKQGAARTTTDVLRATPDHTVVAVTVHESTDPTRVLCRATVGLQPAP